MKKRWQIALTVSAAVRKVLRPPPLDDVLVFGGLLGVGAGFWFIYPPAAGIVVGWALVALGLLRSKP